MKNVKKNIYKWELYNFTTKSTWTHRFQSNQCPIWKRGRSEEHVNAAVKTDNAEILKRPRSQINKPLKIRVAWRNGATLWRSTALSLIRPIHRRRFDIPDGFVVIQTHVPLGREQFERHWIKNNKIRCVLPALWFRIILQVTRLRSDWNLCRRSLPSVLLNSFLQSKPAFHFLLLISCTLRLSLPLLSLWNLHETLEEHIWY